MLNDEEWQAVSQFSTEEQKPQYTKADKIAMWYFGVIIFYLICQVARILF